MLYFSTTNHKITALRTCLHVKLSNNQLGRQSQESRRGNANNSVTSSENTQMKVAKQTVRPTNTPTRRSLGKAGARPATETSLTGARGVDREGTSFSAE